MFIFNFVYNIIRLGSDKMNLLDSIIIVLFIIGILGGLKSGVIKSTVTLVGTIIVFILAFYLKNPLATILYTYLPFFNILNGAVVINILLYELLAFLIAVAILSLALGILIKVSGFIEKVFNATIILGMISKLLGAIVGFVEAYVLIFILVFVLSQPFLFMNTIYSSKVATFILNHSLVLTDIVSETTGTIEEIYNLKDDYNEENIDEFNYAALDIMMEHKVVDSNTILKLRKNNKLTFNGVDSLIEKYKEE